MQLRQQRDRQLAVDWGDTAMTASVRKIAKIRTGGQSGVDRAALDFAIEHEIPYCGWCPKGGWAEARVCQDIVLKAIAESNLSRNVTIKGGVVMRSITGNIRRATQDMDLDFIRYSLNEDAIRQFIDKLNCLEGIFIKITGKIEELSQQEYRGKRVYVVLEDDTGHSFISKIDLGVHKNIQVAQDEYCFDVCLDDEGASLLINSKEQIFAEKLRSLLRFGPLSHDLRIYLISAILQSMWIGRGFRTV